MKHIDKIKKLLRLSESPNENEAKAALAKAMELAMQHAVDLDEIRRESDMSDMGHRWFPCGARISLEAQHAYGIARDFFQVATCVSRAKRQIVFIGREDAIEVANYVVGFLIGACRREARIWEKLERFHRRRVTSGKRAGFKTGFMIGVRVTLADAQEKAEVASDTLAIVLASESSKREDYLAGMFGKTVNIKRRAPRKSSAAISAGYRVGRKTQIHPAVKTTPEELRLS